MLPQQSALSRQHIHRGKRIPVSTQIVTNHFGAEAISALITVKVEEKTQVKNKNKKSRGAIVGLRV